MKKRLLVITAFLFLNGAFADVYCPPKLECKNTQCSGMEGFHFGNVLPGIDGTYSFKAAGFNGQNPIEASCGYVLDSKTKSCNARIIADNSWPPDLRVSGNLWKPSPYSQYISICEGPLEACPFKSV